MPIRANSKKFERAEIGQSSAVFTYAALIPIKSDGTIDIAVDHQGPGRFLLNPSTWEESKSSKWIPVDIPGQSDPILQWLSSGPRVVNFEALVTIDTSWYSAESSKIPAQQKSSLQSVTNSVFASIAGSFFSVTAPAPQYQSLDNSTLTTPNLLNISGRLNYYRSLLYPVYDSITNPQTLVNSPPLLALYTGQSINKNPYPTSGKIVSGSEIWVLTNLKIRITKQLPNLTPIEATVEFELMQYNIISKDRRFFQPYQNVSTIQPS